MVRFDRSWYRVLLLLMPTLIMRVSIPAGYMLVAAGSGLLFELCRKGCRPHSCRSWARNIITMKICRNKSYQDHLAGINRADGSDIQRGTRLFGAKRTLNVGAIYRF